jgi:hypothetical protein
MQGVENIIARIVENTRRENIVRAVNTWNRTIGLKMCVIGDPIIDIYHMAHSGGVSHDGPLVNCIQQIECEYAGGRDLVARILLGCNAEVTVTDVAKPFVKKHRLVCDKIKVARWTEPTHYKRLSNKYLYNNYEAYIVSSFGLGTVSGGFKDVAEHVGQSPVFVDCQNPVDILSWTQNQCTLFATKQEWDIAYPMTDKNVKSFKEVIQKDGASGCRFENERMEAFNLNPVDTTGSGDCFLAVASMMLTVDDKDLYSACLIASIASAIKCMTMGNVSVTRDQIDNVIRRTL